MIFLISIVWLIHFPAHFDLVLIGGGFLSGVNCHLPAFPERRSIA